MSEHHSCVCSKENCPKAPIMVLFVSDDEKAYHFHGCAEHETGLEEMAATFRESMPQVNIIITRSN